MWKTKLFRKNEEKQDSSNVASIGDVSNVPENDNESASDDLRERNRAILNILDDVAQSERNLHRKTVELQKANELVEQQKERAESILRFLKSIGDGVVAADLTGKIIFFNEAAEKLTGISNEKAMDENADEVLALYSEKSHKQLCNIIELTLKNKSIPRFPGEHFFIRRKDGSKIAVSFSVSLIADTQKEMQGCILVVRDVTEQRELEKTKDNFLSVAAHQLRTPLSGIRWDLEMLIDGDVGELSEEAKETVKHIDENTQRLVVLVNDLLDVSRINMGKTKEESVPINICKMLNEATEGLAGLIKERGVEVSLNKVCTLNPTVKAPSRHIFQVFENLLSNAVKYTSRGGKVRIVADCKNDKVIISISDNGIGIPQKDQEKLFTKFFRASNAVLKETEGSGLGLNVVKSFVEEAGGEISFKSVEGKGSTFFVTLPAYKEK